MPNEATAAHLPMMVRQDTGELLEPAEALRALATPAMIEAHKELQRAVSSASAALISSKDIQDGYWIKSAFQKMGRAFGLSHETVGTRVEYFDLSDADVQLNIPYHLSAEVRVRTWSPWGQSIETVARCSTRESRFYYQKSGAPNMNLFQRAEHDCIGTAETRARNRGVDSLLALGKAGDTETDEEAQQRRKEKCLQRQQTWKEILHKHSIDVEAELAYYAMNPQIPDGEETFDVEDYERCLRHFTQHGQEMFARAVTALRERGDDPWDSILEQESKQADETEQTTTDGSGPPLQTDDSGPEPDVGIPPEDFFTDEERGRAGTTEPVEKPEEPVTQKPGTPEKAAAIAEILTYTDLLGEDPATYPLIFAATKLDRELSGLQALEAQEAVEIARQLHDVVADRSAGA